jgi:hypothetical protein
VSWVFIFVLGKVSTLWVFARAWLTDATHTWRNIDQKTVYFTQDKDIVIHSVSDHEHDGEMNIQRAKPAGCSSRHRDH